MNIILQPNFLESFVNVCDLNLSSWKFRSVAVELSANGSPFDYSHDTT